MPCAVLRPLTTCSRPRRPSAAPVRSPGCSTRPSPTSCSPHGTSPATKAPCSTCSSAKPSAPAGRTATCANTRPSTPPPPAGSISFLRIRTTCSPSIRPGWCPTSMPHDPPRRGPPPPCTGKAAHHLARLDRPARASQLELTAHRLGCRSLAARIAERRTRPALADPLVPRSPGHRPPGPHRPQRRGERGGGRGAAGRHPGHRQRRRRRHGAGVAAGRRHPGRGAADRPHRRGERGGGRGAAGRHPGHRQRRRRRHGAGVAAGRRRPGRGAADRPRPAG